MNEKSKKAVEQRIDQEMKNFLENYIGEHPKTVNTQIVGDTIIVRFKSVLPPAERNMIRNREGAKTIKELKEKIYSEATPLLKELIESVTGIEVAEVHSSFDVKTDERMEVFTLINGIG